MTSPKESGVGREGGTPDGALERAEHEESRGEAPSSGGAEAPSGANASTRDPYADLVAAPHDGLFRRTFTRPDHARGLLELVLPGWLARACDWSTLQVEPAGVVDRALRSRYTDLLCAVRWRAPGAGRTGEGPGEPGDADPAVDDPGACAAEDSADARDGASPTWATEEPIGASVGASAPDDPGDLRGDGAEAGGARVPVVVSRGGPAPAGAGDCTLELLALVEHAAAGDRWLSLRLPGYVVRLLERRREREPGLIHLPAPYVLLVQQGDWAPPGPLLGLVGAPAAVRARFARFTPSISPQVLRLPALGLDDLRRRGLPALARCALVLLRDAPRAVDLRETLRALAPELQELASATEDPAWFVTLVVYCASARGERTLSEYADVAGACVGFERRERVMNGYVRWREEAIAIGEARGAAAARRALERLLALRFGPLDEATRTRLAGADLDGLIAWIDRVDEAAKLEDVFAPT